MRAIPLLLLAGCTHGHPLNAPNEPVCEETVILTSWDDASLGFTAAEVLAALGSPLSLSVSWTEITFDAAEASLEVAVSEHGALNPWLVTRTDVVDHPDGCTQWGGAPEGSYLRIPLELAASDPDGGFAIDEPGPFEEGAFELDASAASADAVWFDWEFGTEDPLEDSFSGDWLTAAEACLYEHWGPDELDFRETRLILQGQPATGEVDIELGGDTEDAKSLKACWRGVWE
jgi:hypothetical protein